MGEVVPLSARFPKELYARAADMPTIEAVTGKGVKVIALHSTFDSLIADYPDRPMTFSSGHTHLCPDLLDHARIGEADTRRGKVVRAFFFVMRLWPVRRA